MKRRGFIKLLSGTALGLSVLKPARAKEPEPEEFGRSLHDSPELKRVRRVPEVLRMTEEERAELTDVIYNISPVDSPFVARVKKRG